MRSQTYSDRLTLEICVPDIDGVARAKAGGADRIELMADFSAGGLTPSAGTIAAAVEAAAGMQVNVMIRPRAGDFVYSDAEFGVMARDIGALRREFGSDGRLVGVVFGVLTPAGELDVARMSALVEEAGGMTVTCHRAFDWVVDQADALEALCAIGAQRVLSAGRGPGGREQVATVAALSRRAAGRIEVMGTGDVAPERARNVLKLAGIRSLHTAALRAGESFGAYGDDPELTLVTSEALVCDYRRALDA